MRLLQRDGAFAIVFTLLYALFLGWFMQFHELWFDETMPWLLALYSKTYPELLQNKIYEGHPNLWYSLLYVITRFTQNLQALKASQFVFAVGFVFVFLRYAPFHWAIRLLFCFGYYGLFEYGVISRLYAMELLTLFSVCALYPKRFSHWYLYLLVLCLCAHTHLFGLMFCGVMGLLLFSEAFGFWKNVPHRLDIPLRKRWIGLLLWALNCLLSVWSMARPGEFLNGNVTFRASTRIWQAFFPIPQFNVQFWNSSLFHEAYEVAFSILIFGLLVYSLRKTWPILLTLLALYGGAMALFLLKYPGFLRHHAHFFLFFLTTTWLLYYYRPLSAEAGKLYRRFHGALLFLTLLHFGLGVYALSVDYRYPFFAGKDATEFLKKIPYRYELVTADDVVSSTVVAYGGKPIYNPSLGKYSTYFELNNFVKNHMLPPMQQLEWARAYAQEKQQTVIVISSYDLALQWHPYPIKRLASFDKDYIQPHHLSIYLYQVEPGPFPSQSYIGGFPAGAVKATP